MSQHGVLSIPVMCRIGRDGPWEALGSQSELALATPATFSP